MSSGWSQTTGKERVLPGLAGVVATGDTEDDCAESMREAIAFHIEGLIRHGYPVPPPGNSTRTVHVDAA